MNNTQQRYVTIGLVLGLLVSVGVFGYALTRPQANTEVRLVPNDAVLELDGNTKVKEGTLYIEPGEHRIKASRDGFKTVEQTFTSSDTSSVKLAFSLVPNSKVGTTYLKEHPDEQTEREEISGERYNLGIKNLAKNYPITQMLPHNGEGFSVGYGQSQLSPEDTNKIALSIELDTLNQKDRALNWIRYSGYNPADFEIIYDVQDGGE
jgi:hypothetical protein